MAPATRSLAVHPTALVVAAVLIIGVTAILALARIISDSLASSVDPGPSLADVPVGGCGNLPPGGPVEIVDCDEPHSFQVLSSGTFRATPEITELDALQAAVVRQCEADFEDIVGRSAASAGVRLDPSYRFSRVMQDREGPYTCTIRSATQERLVGSYTDIDT